MFNRGIRLDLINQRLSFDFCILCVKNYMFLWDEFLVGLGFLVFFFVVSNV